MDDAQVDVNDVVQNITAIYSEQNARLASELGMERAISKKLRETVKEQNEMLELAGKQIAAHEEFEKDRLEKEIASMPVSGSN